ncbi:MAG: hypothetical protein ACREM8_03660 [Vulcanimicrobiaceae bacterium]
MNRKTTTGPARGLCPGSGAKLAALDFSGKQMTDVDFDAAHLVNFSLRTLGPIASRSSTRRFNAE